MLLLRGARLIWLVVALAASARAGVARAPSPVYAAPAVTWAGPLGAAFVDPALSGLLPPSLTTPDLSAPQALRATSPLVRHLAHSLSLTPEKFAILPVAEKKAVLELASEAARDELRETVYKLAERARSLALPGKNLDREARAELYETVARLMEVREHYPAWLDEAESLSIEESYRLSSTRAWEARAALIGDAAAPLGGTQAATPLAVRLPPTPAARRLREDMQATKNGWGQSDLDALYKGYGFELRQGGKHRFYSHPDFPQLHAAVSRQNELPPGYAQHALKTIAELERLTAPSKAAAPVASGPPATLDLADLAVLLSPPAAKIEAPKAAADRAPPRASASFRPALSPATIRVAEKKAEPPPAAPAPKPQGWVEKLLDEI